MADVYNSEAQSSKGAEVQGGQAQPTQEPRVEEKQPAWWTAMIDKVLEEAGEKPRRELHGAYHVRPKERFVTQQQDEEIVLLLRSHPIVNLWWILLAGVMLIVPSFFESTGMFAGVPANFMFVGKMVWYLMTWAFAFERFLHWYYSIFIVTNERVIDIDFYNLMSRVVTHVNLNHIEEPVMGAHGFGSTIFNYGFVLVQTAGQKSTVECRACPWPHKVVDIINRLAEELEKRRERGE